MNYGQIRKYDIANGVGIRTSVFVTGCTRHCPDCFNEEYQDFQAGKPWTDAETAMVLDYLADDNVEGLTFLGGEPMQNTEGLTALAHTVKEKSKKSIWVYSGYLLEEILADPDKKALLETCDVLVDGPFVAALRNPRLRFRGSANQRVIDIQKTLAQGDVVLYRDDITGEVM